MKAPYHLVLAPGRWRRCFAPTSLRLSAAGPAGKPSSPGSLPGLRPGHPADLPQVPKGVENVCSRERPPQHL